MNLSISFILILGSLVYGYRAQAQVIDTACLVEIQNDQAGYYFGDPDGLFHLAALTPARIRSCREAKGKLKAFETLSILAQPLAIMAWNPQVQAMLATTTAALAANPVVLTVAVFGAGGFATYYLVLQARIEECDDEIMQDMIKAEVQRITGGMVRQALEVEVDKTGSRRPPRSNR